MSVTTDVPWAIGSYLDDAGRRRPWRISHDEINRDIGVATRVLGELDVAGHGVLWCSLLSQAGQFWPYLCGTVLAGGRLSCADATEGEAARVAMFLRLLPYRAVFGLNDAVLDGLEELGIDLRACFGDVAIVGALPGAYERLAELGLPATRFAVCGPALAIGRRPGAPALVETDEWHVEDDRGTVVISSRQARAQPFVRVPVARSLQVVDGGLTW